MAQIQNAYHGSERERARSRELNIEVTMPSGSETKYAIFKRC